MSCKVTFEISYNKTHYAAPHPRTSRIKILSEYWADGIAVIDDFPFPPYPDLLLGKSPVRIAQVRYMGMMGGKLEFVATCESISDPIGCRPESYETWGTTAEMEAAIRESGLPWRFTERVRDNEPDDYDKRCDELEREYDLAQAEKNREAGIVLEDLSTQEGLRMLEDDHEHQKRSIWQWLFGQ